MTLRTAQKLCQTGLFIAKWEGVQFEAVGGLGVGWGGVRGA